MPSSAERSTFRHDVHGLRGVAVSLVVLDHVHFLATGGYVGVDVFFVISGFLITGHVLAELEQRGRIDLVAFWGRRMRRILPAALGVALVTFVASVLLMPPLLGSGLVRMVIAVAAYVPNLQLAADGTDYLAETSPSPFQHYWSLGVEEQFYVLWPVLLLVGWLVLRSVRRVGWVVLGVVVVSFVLCVAVAGVSQPWAFFSLPTRAWELAVGGLVAVLLRRGVAVPRSGGALMAWVGLAGILVAGFAYDASTPYPGVATLLPVLGAAALVLGGAGGSSWGPVALFRRRPLQFLGTISYSLYLWHWPLLVIPQAAVGLRDPLPAWVAVLEVAAALGLAVLTHRFVEEPFRRARWTVLRGRRRSMALGALASVTVVGVALAALPVLEARPTSTTRVASAVTPSSSPVFTGYVPENLAPSLRDAASTASTMHVNGCHVADRDDTTIHACVMGDPDGALTVALVGDSHAAHWFPALERWAEHRGGVRLLGYSKAGCPVTDVLIRNAGVPFAACETWREAALERLRAERPDVVLVSNSSRLPFAEPGPRVAAWSNGMERLFDDLPPSSRVAVIANTPQFEESVPRCLSANLDDTAACAAARDVAVDTDWIAAERAVTERRGHGYVDLTDWFCDAERCGAVQGDVLEFRDHSHLTTAWARELWWEFGGAVDSAR
ncbi:Peptidoglycan/LPS O-acetylase OafA/YrhL, contains acyltransferase and SGNH-hydrolase domains [Curtobacterium sp. 314Chir4.1]|uniref:acyltransferase family protein n=1 Tax=Curtobacterium sp. 314Chir4.1 TaxID=1279028 RepID=UPI000BD83F81|nr:acyltransferase family protein [Curtobacterium sp. 314Chir4.1]SOC89751.1 Peptidoglycan/LPS O-acetylase OafA/YrhL, contains acyltransferase and SGNH-hydrolase domains [Curtobacterium sp. 314Chir4.1]